jgi:hypothetical protein
VQLGLCIQCWADTYVVCGCGAWYGNCAQVHEKGGWVWQMFTENSIEDNRTAGGPLGDRSKCIEAYQQACSPTSKQQYAQTLEL